MTSEQERTQLRSYVLGTLTDEESAAVEEQYFVDPDALARVSAVEDELIEDYLEQRLDPPARTRFESHYLSTPGHRARVAVARGLMKAAAGMRPGTLAASGPAPNAAAEVTPFDAAARVRREEATRGWSLSRFQQLALAASIVLIAGIAAVWMFPGLIDGGETPPTAASVTSSQPSDAQLPRPSTTPSTPPPTAAASPATAPAPPDAPLAAPPVLALSLSPINVRGAGAEATVTLAPDTDAVLLQLEDDGDKTPLRQARVVVRTVGGQELWRGPATAPAGDARPGLLATARIPANRLRADDLIVELHAADAAGRDAERTRYVFRVKTSPSPAAKPNR